MSRDLSVYLPERPDDAALADAARAAGLELDPSRGLLLLDGEYGADLGGPEPVEPGDVPQQVDPGDVDGPLADRLDDCRWSVDVVVQGSAPEGVTRAIAFARALAGRDGVVEDPADGLWSDGTTHRPEPRNDRIVEVVELRWYARRADISADLPHRWLAACRAHLPAALPVRFGNSEPLRSRSADEGDAGFAAAHGDDLLFYRGSPPCYDGTLAGGGRGTVAAHSLVIDRGVDPDALLALFTALAGATAAFFASASVQRGLTWTGRALFGPGPDQDLHLAPGGTWIGLPARPVAWTWFGPAYARLLPADLPTTAAGDGRLHRWAPAPLDRDALPERWLPPELTATSWEERATRLPHVDRLPHVPRLPPVRRRWWDLRG